jgi:hypothetical protein
MGRPAGYQWEPLGWEQDPVSGDPAAIAQEAQHLASMAQMIRGQVEALREIANDEINVGHTPDKIRSAASDLVDSLQAVEERYQTVSTALDRWIPELEQAQAMSLRALDEAEAPYAQLTKSAALPSGNDLTAREKLEVSDYHAAMSRAQEQLDAAKALLSQAIDLRDTQAGYYAGVINSACDDSLKDSWWQQFENWVAENAWLINDICTVLEVIAAVLAVVALCLSGVGLLALLFWAGIALTSAALMGRILLAATGNGSWFNVGMDVFALLTMGMGEWAAGGLKAVSEASGKLGDIAVAAARSEVMEKLAPVAEKGADVLGPDGMAKVMAKMEPIVENDTKIGEFAAKDLPRTIRLAVKLAGSSEDLENTTKVFAVGTRFADDAGIANKLTAAKSYVRVMGLNAVVANVAGVGVPMIGGIAWTNSAGDPAHWGPVQFGWVSNNWATFKLQNDTTAAIPNSVMMDVSHIVDFSWA